MLPSAEVLISPELSRTAMKEMEREFDRGFKKIGEDAGQSIERGILGGARRASRRMGNAFRNSRVGGFAINQYDRLGGVKALGGGALALAIGGLVDSINRAQQGGDLIGGFLGEGTATAQASKARSVGMSNAEYQAFASSIRSRTNLTDDEDIFDITKEISLRVNEQKLEGKGRLVNFAGYEGKELTARVLAGIGSGNYSKQEQAQIFDEAGLGGTGMVEGLTTYLDSISKGGQLQGGDLYKAILNDQKTAGEKRAEQIAQQIELEKKFREEQREYQNEVREKMLSTLDGNKINALFDTRKTEAERQVKMVEDYEKNAAAAVKAQVVINETMDGLNKSTQMLINTVQKIYEWLTDDSTLMENINNSAQEVAGQQNLPRAQPGTAGRRSRRGGK